MTSERLELRSLTAALPGLVDRLSNEPVEFELTEEGKVVARLVAPLPDEGLSAEEFVKLLEDLPALGDDADAFWSNIQESRNAYLPESDPWVCS